MHVIEAILEGRCVVRRRGAALQARADFRRRSTRQIECRRLPLDPPILPAVRASCNGFRSRRGGSPGRDAAVAQWQSTPLVRERS